LKRGKEIAIKLFTEKETPLESLLFFIIHLELHQSNVSANAHFCAFRVNRSD
jgi:hypothetical protein